jgi:TRAP-type C4-dicarboxylate transport system substrate-binding protein
MVALLASLPASAEPPVVLKLATIIPDGSAYAREAKAFARSVELDTEGRVRVRWIFGAVAGGEAEALERTRRGQLDGGAVAIACGWLAPSLRVFRLPGQFTDRQQARQVLARLRPTVEQELRKSGFALLGMEPFGADIIMSKAPVRSMDDLRRATFWVWDQDEVWRAIAPLIGLRTVTLPIDAVARALEDKRVDALITIPTAALAYQWSSHFRYFTPLQTSYLQACLIVSNRTFDALSIEDQRAIRAAGAKAAAHFDQVCDDQDTRLLGELFEKQGLTRIPVTRDLESSFLREARAAMDRIDDRLVSRASRDRVAGWLTQLKKR